ncbi:hypothetical protein LTR85_007130 [Meristemomyces frigidus]|nr:hypothetical protein LTR85_007130 [Meristemomyces frigidus]
MSDGTLQLPAKPGTACLGCRRRKLKCSREQAGCVNCTKSDLPCVYPAPETGIKRKRGPYKKDKLPRERHLEDLVKYLEPRGSASPSGIADGQPSTEGAGDSSPSLEANTIARIGLLGDKLRQTSHSEDLVKDALIALTKSGVSERESNTETGTRSSHLPARTTVANASSGPGLHPSARRLFEYWHIFVTRVDPLTKAIHCPTLAKRLLAAIDNIESVDNATETLLFSVYYAAVSACTANEVRKRFGESRDALLQRYGRVIESSLNESYGVPALESMQALVIYIICVRRQDDGTSVRTLFKLASSMAQLMGMHRDPGEAYKPYEAELRRRLWWHICGLESRGAEEGGTRTSSIMQGHDVQFPANLNDCDLDPKATQTPQSRAGVTDITFVRLRWEILRLVYGIFSARRQKGEDGRPPSPQTLQAQQNHIFEETKARLEVEYASHLHTSRPYDWMTMQFLEGMFVKTRMIIDYPFGSIPTKDMSAQERLHLLQCSVHIIAFTHVLAIDDRIENWLWFFRGYVQWHSLAIVVAELGHSSNKQFAHSAWAVLDPILADWDRMYQSKKDEPAWEHVNTLIELAKQKRHNNAKRAKVTARKTEQPSARATEVQPAADFPYHTQSTMTLQYAPRADMASDLSFDYQKASALSTPQQAPTPYSLDYQGLSQPATFSYIPPAPEFDVDFGTFDGWDQIDFQAFDAVFGGVGWEFPSPIAEFGMEIPG